MRSEWNEVAKGKGGIAGASAQLLDLANLVQESSMEWSYAIAEASKLVDRLSEVGVHDFDCGSFAVWSLIMMSGIICNPLSGMSHQEGGGDCRR